MNKTQDIFKAYRSMLNEDANEFETGTATFKTNTYASSLKRFLTKRLKASTEGLLVGDILSGDKPEVVFQKDLKSVDYVIPNRFSNILSDRVKSLQDRENEALESGEISLNEGQPFSIFPINPTNELKSMLNDWFPELLQHAQASSEKLEQFVGKDVKKEAYVTIPFPEDNPIWTIRGEEYDSDDKEINVSEIIIRKNQKNIGSIHVPTDLMNKYLEDKNITIGF
jgi:hypothetical protein